MHIGKTTMIVGVMVVGAAGVAQAQGKPKPIVAVAGISHESNSFNPAPTTLADFGDRAVKSKDDFVKAAKVANTIASGYVEAAERFGLDLRPRVITSAAPKGIVTDQAFNTMADDIVKSLKAMPKIDGVLMPLHGAMVVDSFPSGDLELVKRVRKALGPTMPIVVTHDFHANVSPELAQHCHAVITFKENPHIDTKERGFQAGQIIAQMIAGKTKPVQAIAKPDMVYNIVFQYTKRNPLLPIVEESRRLERENPKILAVSVAGGYQYADVPQMGPTVIVVTDGDKALAQSEANRLSDMLWKTRDQIKLNLPDPAAAVKQAMSSDRFPVVLIETGDNIGGGSAGDATFILKELVAQKAEGWVVTIADKEAAQAAFKIGVGGTFEGVVGGKTDKQHGEPVRVRGRVKALTDGHYIEPEVRHGGGHYNSMGMVAVIEVGGTRDLPNILLLTTERSSPNSLHQIISNGVYPQRQKILVVKGMVAPRAAYEPIAGRIIEVDTGGATAVNPARFRYSKVRRPLHGLP